MDAHDANTGTGKASKWVNNGDNTYTAQPGATLWELQQETGVDWHDFGFNRDPKTLQPGETITVSATPVPAVPVITLDAGHGGLDNGNKGIQALEKNINLNITKKIEQQLSGNNYNIVMTRNNDTAVKLESRYTVANNNNSSVFVSIHTNSSNPLKSGFNIIIPDDTLNTRFENIQRQQESQKLAESIYDKLVDAGIKREPDGIYTDVRGLAVLKGTNMPAVLIEVGYIITDGKKLKNDMYLDKLSAAISDGISEYLELYQK